MKKYITPQLLSIGYTDDIMNSSASSPAFSGLEDSGIGETVSLQDWLN